MTPRASSSPLHQGQAPKRPRWVAIATASVLAVLLLLSAIPRFGGGRRLNANETATVATLKRILQAQSRLQSLAAIDCNSDGRGEYATFAELAGAVPLRTSDGIGTGKLLDPPVLSPSFGRLHDGCVHRSGYVYQMFLPGTGGRWQPEARDGGAIAGVDDERASQDWICYAWPIEPGVTGKRSFFIDSRGNFVAQHSATHGYGGGRRPLAGIAAHVFDNGTWGIAANTVDVLGDCWVVVN